VVKPGGASRFMAGMNVKRIICDDVILGVDASGSITCLPLLCYKTHCNVAKLIKNGLPDSCFKRKSCLFPCRGEYMLREHNSWFTYDHRKT
jgi:hypothetical protein